MTKKNQLPKFNKKIMSIKNKKSHLNQKKTWTSLPSKKKKKRESQATSGREKKRCEEKQRSPCAIAHGHFSIMLEAIILKHFLIFIQ